MTCQRQHGQPQPCRPPLGPLMQQRFSALGQGDPRGSQQRAGLSLGKPQLHRPDLGQLTGQPQLMQPQRQIVARGQHRVHLRRKVGQQPGQLCRRLRRAQLVQVIDDQRDAVGGIGQLREHPAGYRRGIGPGCGGRRFRVVGRADGMAYRVEQGQPEELRVVLAGRHLNDGQSTRLARMVGPRAKQRGLPAAGRSRDDRHLPDRRPIQGGHKITPVDPPGGYPVHRHACLGVPRRTACRRRRSPLAIRPARVLSTAGAGVPAPGAWPARHTRAAAARGRSYSFSRRSVRTSS